MAYDEGLAERLRGALEDERLITEKTMFGGIVFMHEGKIAVGVIKESLLVRVQPEGQAAALEKKHVGPMTFTGKPFKGFVIVEPEGVDSDRALELWVAVGVAGAKAAAAVVTKPSRAKGTAATKGKARRSR